jgi:hypothetical protein
METEENDFTCRLTDGPVSLTVTIGEGQLGATSVFRKDVRLVRGGVVIAGLRLGDSDDLVDDAISVESIVNDISTQTDRMSVRYVVENAGRRCDFLARHEVETEGAICRFVSTIAFAR